MNVTLLKSLIALLPTCVLFSDSVILFLRGKTAYILLQLVGAGCLVIVALTHLFEVRSSKLVPSDALGLENSVGQYLDFSTAVLGFTLFTVGYLLHVLTKR